MGKLRTDDVDGMARAMGAGEPFETNGKLWGRPGSASGWGLGRLPEDWHEDAGEAVYVVFSHATPIAWQYSDGDWACPEVSHSVSTSRHQNRVRAAMKMLALSA